MGESSAMTCTHPKTRLVKIQKIDELRDGERITYNECVCCGESVNTVEVRVPASMAVMTAFNRVTELLNDKN